MTKVKSKMKLLVMLGLALLTVCIFSTTVNATEVKVSNENIGFYINDVKYNQENINNVDGISFNKEQSKLTLNNYNGKSIFIDYDTEHRYIDEEEVLATGNTYHTEITIEILGNNILTDNEYGLLDSQEGDIGRVGINFTLTGNGKLNIPNGALAFCGGTFTLNGPEVYTKYLSTEKVNIKSGYIEFVNNETFIDFSINNNMTCVDENGNTIYLVSKKDNYNNISYTFCKSNTYSSNSLCNKVIIKDKEENQEIPQTEKTTTIVTTDTNTKIKLDTTTDVVPEGTTLVAEKVTSGDNYNTVVKAVEKDVEKFVLYDISLVNNNATIQPNGKVKVSIPIPDGYDASKIVVFRVAEDGTKTKLDATVKDGYITFETDHFSNYVVGEEKTETAEETSTEATDTSTKSNTTKRELDNTPKTGSDPNVLTVISSIISLISAGAVALVKKF